MEITYRASDDVHAVIGSMGRTEDIRFSPSNRRLAIAAFSRSRIAVLGIDIGNAKQVVLTGAVQISSESLDHPHGLDFIDDDTLAVANRNGDVAVFKVPPSGISPENLSPIRILRADDTSLLRSPGSLSIVRKDKALHELLICNNGGNSVTRHQVDCSSGCSIGSGEILLKKWLNLPDGICVSHDRQWIAVSNHNTHDVLLYRNSPTLNEHAEPDGALRCAYYPHGLRFSADGRHIFVADAGAPYVHVYASDGRDWRGARSPAMSFRVMDDRVFSLGRQNPQEGGPKGIDIDAGMNLLVATSEHQPLAMFDLPAILERVPSDPFVQDVEYELGILAHADRLGVRLMHAERRAAKAEAKVAKAKARLAKVKNGWPFRITTPLSRIYSAFKRAN
jgi:hypothetical protein